MNRLKLLLSFIFMTTLISAYAFGQAPAPAQRAPAIPQNDYLILIHYDLGMHCTGFDLSYCCILPPYNSILAQVVKPAKRPGDLPSLVKEDDLKKAGLVLWYEHENNTYSEGSKMLYWNVPYDVNKNGSTSDAVDSMANAEFMQLYTYGENPLGPKPEKTSKKLTVGLDINIPQDHGPTGKPMSFGQLDFTGETGTIVYTLLNDGQSEIAIPLSMREYWEALGLPLTAFPDGSVGTIRRVTEEIMRPYVKANVTLAKWEDKNTDGQVQANEITPVKHRDGRPASFFGTNPIDVPACDKCHATPRANGSEFQLWKKEYDFWKQTFPDTTDYYSRIKAASISLLEIHDQRSGTDFLKNYNPADKTGASINRLGGSAIKCQDCHADNIIGVLKSASNPQTRKPVSALTRAMHLKHLEKEPQPDTFGRTANCQTCHPAHQQSGSLARVPIGQGGHFKGGDIRDWSGCYVGRDVHSNPRAKREITPASHLNAVGRWLKDNVTKDGKGLYCTNCHNLGSRLLYKSDQLQDAITPAGTTLRNKSLEEIVTALRQMEGGKYKNYRMADFFDPKVSPVDRVADVWRDAASPPYDKVDDGGDYWLAAGEPHCADCHQPPFVEGMGGTYFPIDQPGKYALMRYSKGHHGVSCQSCHESTHGLYPVNPSGPDPISYAQVAALNPDRSHGPVKCAACHVVDKEGVPTLLQNKLLAGFPDRAYPGRYEKAVAYAHTRRIDAERRVKATSSGKN